MTVDGHALLTAAAEGVELVRAAGTVEALREVKDAGEIALLRLACEAADAALADLVAAGGLRPGRTEREVGRDLESRMLDHGADGVSFETIVATGANSRDSAPPPDRRRAAPPATSSRSTSAHWSRATTRT